MKVDRGWIWRVLLLTSLVVMVIEAQDEQPDVHVSDADELSLNQEEEEEEVVTLVGKDEVHVRGEDGGDENVSFQVSDGRYFRVIFKSKVASPKGTWWFMDVGTGLDVTSFSLATR